MQQFAKLIEQIEQTKSTKEKVQRIQHYFETTPSEEAAWALYLLLGNKLKRVIGPSKLFEWSFEALFPLPEWLILESYSAVGDLAETISLLMQKKKQSPTTENALSLSEWINHKILPLQKIDKDLQKQRIIKFWNELPSQSIFVLNKILTGSLRIGVSHLLTIEGLSKAINIPKETISQRLMGQWEPSTEFFDSLKNQEYLANAVHLNPYPFYLASPIQEPLETLGKPDEWIAEWKWDGIRAQIIKRNGHVAIWSRGNELISHQFPEIVESLNAMNDGTVLDGEILAFRENKPLPFGELQKRLGRKKVTTNMIKSVPIVFMIYDLLEYDYADMRKKPYSERRAILETCVNDPGIKISPLIPFQDWNEIKSKRLEASSNNTEGVMLKKNNSPYLIGRRKGNWWKYKIDPKTIDAVLIYAQPGNGWRANLYTDYTFGVWHHQELVPIAKAYSGLSMDEIYLLDKWIRKNTLEKFGPVRSVKAEQVFEIAFEGIQTSSRHKAGIAFRFPRIMRWRHDKPIQECDTLEGIKKEFMDQNDSQ